MNLAGLAKLDQKLRTARRYQELVSILAKHGFNSFVVESGLGVWLKREFNLNISLNGSHSNQRLPREVRTRQVVEDLGPTFIKVGQILSTRSDLIPESFATELKLLQSNVEPVDFAEIQVVLEQEFPGRLDQVFARIDEEPLASASLAQAHIAELRDGTEVVLKILKPGVVELIEADIGVINSVADFLARNFPQAGFHPNEVALEFSRQLKREVDLLHEARATERLRSYFDHDPSIFFPRVYREASTHRVLAVERIHGRLLSETPVSDLSVEDRRQIIENGARAVFRQCFEIGYFHADPHPGNIFVLPEGRICLIDCGMTGSIDAQTSELLACLIHAAVQADLDRVIDVAMELTDCDRSIAQRRTFRNEVWEFISRFQESTLESLQVGQLLRDFFHLLRRNDIRCPGDIVFLIKAVTTIEGIAEELDPSFDLIAFARPYLEHFIYQRRGPAAIAGRVRDSLVDYGELLESLPRWLRDVFARARSSRFPLKVEHRGLRELTVALNHVGNAVSSALIAAALLIGSSILVLADSVAGGQGFTGKIGTIGFIAAVVLVIVTVVSNYFSGKKN